MAVLNSKRIAQAAQMACLLEVSADKPGNINRTHDFSDSRYEDYLPVSYTHLTLPTNREV